MTAKMKFEGTDVDGAINKACLKFSVPREKLNIEIVSTGSTGIFGLCKKKAIIRVSSKEAISPQAKSKNKPSRNDSPKISTKTGNKEKTNRETVIAAPKATTQKHGDPKEPKSSPKQQVAAPSPEVIDYLKTNLHRLLELMGFPPEINVSEKDNKIFLQISSDFNDKLTSKDGQLLDSLQYLLRKMISAKFPQKVLFSIDADNFRETRRANLIEQAKKLALETKETGKTKTIPPLNPAERRIVHMALQDDTSIRSRSVGDGLFKKILIYLPGKEKKRPPRRRGRKSTPQAKNPSPNKKTNPVIREPKTLK